MLLGLQNVAIDTVCAVGVAAHIYMKALLRQITLRGNKLKCVTPAFTVVDTSGMHVLRQLFRAVVRGVLELVLEVIKHISEGCKPSDIVLLTH